MVATEMAHLLVFFTSNLLTFFTAYETVLIPLMVIIGQGGSGAGRLRAALLFFIYTLAGSISILLAVLYLISSTGEILNCGSEALVSLTLTQSSASMLWVAFGVSFAVKTPLYPFLVWLIHAHAEAPLEGSIILAGVVLKLAIFGVSALLVGLLWEGGLVTLSYSLSLSLATLLLASGAIVQQIDLKGFVALSSVAHMGLGTLGILSLTEDGTAGS
jgi:NADH:ubiquinone oxidoreductase subunit 4 (subunit M)